MKTLYFVVGSVFIAIFLPLSVFAEIRINDESAVIKTQTKSDNEALLSNEKVINLENRALSGDIVSANKLGYHSYQLNTKDGFLKAIKWFSISAEKGNKPAQLALGYLIGITDKNLILANEWIEKAYSYKPGRALYFKYLINNQEGLFYDQVELFNILDQAAKYNDPFALNELGINAEKSKQLDIAKDYYKKASKYGSKAAKINLDRLSNNSQSVNSDKLDLQLLITRADLGDATAQYQLATYYHKGIGVVKNYSQAIKYYQLSAAQNYIPAKKLLQLILSGPKSRTEVNSAWMAELENVIPSHQIGIDIQKGFSPLNGNKSGGRVIAVDTDVLYDLFK